MQRKVTLQQNVMAADERHAQNIRKRLAEAGVLMVNLIGSPGAGKTTLLEATFRKTPLRMAVIEGDVATSRDAQRIAAAGVPVVQINTQGGCHLEAHLVERALEALPPLAELDLLIVENVGNLVCPAEFDLGEDFKVAVSSVPEGSDKPLKYPLLFTEAKAVILTKIDLAPYIAFDKALFFDDVKKLNPEGVLLEVDSIHGDGIESWCGLLQEWVCAKDVSK